MRYNVVAAYKSRRVARKRTEFNIVALVRLSARRVSNRLRLPFLPRPSSDTVNYVYTHFGCVREKRAKRFLGDFSPRPSFAESFPSRVHHNISVAAARAAASLAGRRFGRLFSTIFPSFTKSSQKNYHPVTIRLSYH